MVVPFSEIQKQPLIGGGAKGTFGIDDPRPRSLYTESDSLVCFQHDLTIAVEREQARPAPMHGIAELDPADRIDSDGFVESGRERSA
jgi:hypothetical protein